MAQIWLNQPKLIVFSGAGLSAESGLNTFRGGDDALWNNTPIKQVCDGLTWKQNRDQVMRFYNERRVELATVQPNSAHAAIARWQRLWPTVIVTQNIDNLLERAGAHDVVHLHGRLTEMRDEACGHVWDIGYRPYGEAERCPRCPSRNGTRPNVVFFHEDAPEYRTFWKVWRSISRFDVLVVIGTTGIVSGFGETLSAAPCAKLLNYLEPSGAFNEPVFDRVFHEPATTAVAKIEAFLRGHFGAESPVAR